MTDSLNRSVGPTRSTGSHGRTDRLTNAETTQLETSPCVDTRARSHTEFIPTPRQEGDKRMTEIETHPVHLGIYVDTSDNDDAFKLRRFTGTPERPGGFTGWQKSAGWSPVLAPVNPVHLIEGPVLVIGAKEPVGIGAVAVEYETNKVWIGDGSGQWWSNGDCLEWAELRHPVVRSVGSHPSSVARGGAR